MSGLWLLYNYGKSYLSVDVDSIDFSRFCLHRFDISILRADLRHQYLQEGYTIEIEDHNLLELSHQGAIIAPSVSNEEMCSFIKLDLASHAKD